MPVDMSSLSSVRDFASSVSALINAGSLPRIRAIVCAAAVMQVGGKRATKDGMEATFQVNYLANFLLVLLLLPMMKRDCRIMFFTSNLMPDAGESRGSKVARFEEYVTKLPDPVVEETGRGQSFAEGTKRYVISKVLLSMFAVELQRRLDRSSDFSGISVVLLDPGTFISGMLNGKSRMHVSQVLQCDDDAFYAQNTRRPSERSRYMLFHFSQIFQHPSRGWSRQTSRAPARLLAMC
jgi:NAD(P)-dependent dehydrogenase (short-subunit alcohol dehydrogenase family)